MVTVRLSSSEPSSSASPPASVIRACTVSATRLVQAQPPLHHGATRLGPHPAGVRPAAEEQTEAGHHHGLARTGLPGDDVHPAGQRQRGVFDDAQSGDAQLFQHSTRH